MPPVLQRLVAFALGVLLCLVLLGQVPFVVADHFSHVAKVFFVILGWVFFGILLQDLNDLTTTVLCVSCIWCNQQATYFTFRDQSIPRNRLPYPTQNSEIAPVLTILQAPRLSY